MWQVAQIQMSSEINWCWFVSLLFGICFFLFKTKIKASKLETGQLFSYFLQKLPGQSTIMSSPAINTRPRRAAASRKPAIVVSSNEDSDSSNSYPTPKPRRKVAARKTKEADESYVDLLSDSSPKLAAKSKKPVKRKRAEIAASDSENSPKNKPAPKATTSKTTAKTEGKAKRVTAPKRKAQSEDLLDAPKEPAVKKTKITVSKDTSADITSNELPFKKTQDSTAENPFASSTQRQQLRTSKRFELPVKTWTEPQLLAQLQQLDYSTAENIIHLFNEDNTIPFICRYRKEAIGDLNPDQ